ncbi:MAG: 2-dehydro-3-deoxyphosphooctonate aldolase, partial [Pseudomonadota bacterium]
MPDQPPHPLSPQDCLIAVMVIVSISDENIRTAELVKMENAVNNLPVFGTYDVDRIKLIVQMVFDLISEEDGLDALFGLVRDNL